MFAALTQANIDWNIIAGAIATFIVTGIATALGFRKGIKKVRETKTEVAPIVGASIMDNMTILMLTETLKESNDLHKQILACLTELKIILSIGINKID